MTAAYGAFAFAYDRALGERFFRSARRMLEAVEARHPSATRNHLDLACGTGLTVRFFAARGWRSTGLDLSLSMLAVARERSARLVCGDLRSLPLRGPFARVTCLYDSLNHLQNRVDLVSAFREVRRVMSEDSLFLFDMNHPDIYPEVWGMKEPFVASGPGFHLEIATSYRRRDARGRALVSGWAMQRPGRRIEIHETHEQRAYSQSEIVRSLREACLEPVEILDFDPYNEKESLKAGGVKLFFVCRQS